MTEPVQQHPVPADEPDHTPPPADPDLNPEDVDWHPLPIPGGEPE